MIGKHWCFTINSTELVDAKNILPIIMDLKNSKEITFIVFQMEKGKMGTEHIQGYLEVAGGKNGKSIKSVKKILGCEWTHLEKAKGTKKQNIEYCSKAETKISETYMFGDATSQGDRTDLNMLCEEIKSEKKLKDIVMDNPEMFIKYGGKIKELKTMFDSNNNELRNIKCEIYIGIAGSGKTWKAVNENNDNYILGKGNGSNLWFSNYNGEKCLIIDEYDGWIEIKKLFRILDKYKLEVETKGGSVFAKWIKVIIISNIDIYKWYPGLAIELREALMRRIYKIWKFEVLKGVDLDDERYKKTNIVEYDKKTIWSL
nr:MAG: replication associated protein [Cressdnaviricota sp.]